ncbi:MAG: gamma-glutamyltransferase [Candidatus Bathyarchaeota archaeon]|nr:gamma-glutamyltransferase [Candidatus Bathyarchaeota archaeon]
MDCKNYIYQARRWMGAGRSDCVAEKGMVSSKHPLIGEAGVKMMKKGGNAVDAAVASAFMDCVVEPAMNGIGGEGVMAIHLESGENIIIDYVGRPAQSCTPDMYELEEITESGWMGWRKVKDDANLVGHKACTTPGIVAGLTSALEHYGTMSLADVISPAVKVAEEGFTMGWWTAASIFRRMEAFSKFKEWKRVYLRDGQYPYLPYNQGMAKPHVLVNKELAKCLRSIRMEGPDAFYKGWIADAIAGEMSANGGLITKEDMAMYEPIIHMPELGCYRGHDILYDPTHSGTTMMQTLNIIEGYDMASMGFGSPDAIHLVAEALGLAFADRFEYMGDPGYVDVPQKAMVSKEYAAKLRERIDMGKSGAVTFSDPWPHKPECTTALAVADKAGNMACVNQTLVNSFGCGVVIPGTGIVMNNAMYGLNPEPGHANSIDGRKRRIQNVCPTVVLREDESYMVLGAPGGRNIQMSVAQAIHYVIDYGMGIQDAVDAPRISRETGTVSLDSRFPREVKDRLVAMGHDVNYVDPELRGWGRPVGVLRDPETKLLHGGVYSLLTGFESIAVGL